MTLTKDGGATVALDGASESPGLAARDAAFLNEEIERATSFRIAIVTVRASSTRSSSSPRGPREVEPA